MGALEHQVGVHDAVVSPPGDQQGRRFTGAGLLLRRVERGTLLLTPRIVFAAPTVGVVLGKDPDLFGVAAPILCLVLHARRPLGRVSLFAKPDCDGA
jgi:hypothetical protein